MIYSFSNYGHIEKSSTLLLSQYILADLLIFMSAGKILQDYFAKTKLMKAIANSLWDPSGEIDDYYARVNCHDEAMGLWVMHYVQNEKMIKKGKDMNEDQDEQDNVSNFKQWKR